MSRILSLRLIHAMHALTSISYVGLQFINRVPFTQKSESRDCTCYGSGGLPSPDFPMKMKCSFLQYINYMA